VRSSGRGSSGRCIEVLQVLGGVQAQHERRRLLSMPCIHLAMLLVGGKGADGRPPRSKLATRHPSSHWSAIRCGMLLLQTFRGYSAHSPCCLRPSSCHQFETIGRAVDGLQGTSREQYMKKSVELADMRGPLWLQKKIILARGQLQNRAEARRRRRRQRRRVHQSRPCRGRGSERPFERESRQSGCRRSASEGESL
jgi:hypothetical protein